MDPTETGGMKPEETPGDSAPGDEKEAAAGMQQTAEFLATPAEKAPKKDRNWMQVALIAVSIVAVLLLIATICLAVTGDFGHHGRFDRFGGPPGRMMRGRGGGQFQDGPRWQQRNQDNGAGQNQPQQSAPVAPPGGQTQ